MSHVPMGSAVAGADLDGTRLSERYPDALVPQGISAGLTRIWPDLGWQAATASQEGRSHR